MVGKNTFATILSSIAGVYFTALWNAWNWGAFITATLQVVIWIGCGITELYKNYNYIVVEKVNKLTRKIELILKFVRGCDCGFYQVNPYEDLEEQKRIVNYEREKTILDQDDNVSSI